MSNPAVLYSVVLPKSLPSTRTKPRIVPRWQPVVRSSPDNDDSFTSAPVRESFATLAEVAAFAFSWAVPTLFLATPAAHPDPVQATTRAREATTREADGWRRAERDIGDPSSGARGRRPSAAP